MKRLRIVCCLLLCLFCFIGCGKNTLQTTAKETTAAANTVISPATGSTNAANTAPATAPLLNRPEVTINGTAFTVNGTTNDVSKRESSINSIIQADYITDIVFVLDCHINPKIAYYALFNTETMSYINSFYGTNITWIDNNMDSVIYALDNTVKDATGKTLYTVDLTATQYIDDLKLSQNGMSVTVTVRDTHTDISADTKTYTFDK